VSPDAAAAGALAAAGLALMVAGLALMVAVATRRDVAHLLRQEIRRPVEKPPTRPTRRPQRWHEGAPEDPVSRWRQGGFG
jgi:hypothetical protein